MLEVLAHNSNKKVVAWFYEERDFSFTGVSSALLNFVNVKWGRNFRTYEELNDFAAAYVVNLWQEEDSKADASYTLAATRATPMSMELLLAFFGYFLAVSLAEVAVSCALMYHCILHTGELFLVEAHNLLFSSCSSRASLSLATAKSANEHGSGEETVKFTDHRIVARLTSPVKDILPGDKLFSTSMSYFRVELKRAKSLFSLDDLHIQAYSLQ
jgi:hypothetical protein